MYDPARDSWNSQQEEEKAREAEARKFATKEEEESNAEAAAALASLSAGIFQPQLEADINKPMTADKPEDDPVAISEAEAKEEAAEKPEIPKESKPRRNGQLEKKETQAEPSEPSPKEEIELPKAKVSEPSEKREAPEVKTLSVEELAPKEETKEAPGTNEEEVKDTRESPREVEKPLSEVKEPPNEVKEFLTEQEASKEKEVLEAAEAPTESKEEADRDEISKNEGNTPPIPAKRSCDPSPVEDDPPRKLKKPSRGGSRGDQEKRAQESRHRMEQREHRSNVESIRSHYNERPENGFVKRRESPIFALRNFNNFIKSALIHLETRPYSTVLDIGCGKGGDLLKWANNKAKGFIGIDIADVSVSQARERYDKLRYKLFWADFCVGDAYRDRVEDIVHPEAFPVDIVSIQFAMHYAFEDEGRAKAMISNVSRSLRPGGRFIGTIPNSDRILSHLAKGESQWGNDIYQVKFENPPTVEEVKKTPYGHRYAFNMTDAIDDVDEYIVPFDAFVDLADKHGLRLVYKKPFLEMFNEEVPRSKTLRDIGSRMRVFAEDGRSSSLTPEEQEASDVYLAFAFERR
ncbi:hypothetical protein TRVA0_002S04016 [Trichomonascus vanleenenianus]|uniref:mRNA (guanine-N7)-methyltransferase n=1 Tax=Trichomonascus vanleenenianus TaxID=2268995 RepID=UPI003ECB6EB2